MSNENNNDELEIQHRLYIQEEEINIPDLPSEIKQAMRNFNAKLKNYEESEDEETNEKLFLELQQDDVEIADNILTWWEDFNSEDDEEQEFEQEEEEEEESKPVEVNSKNTAQPKVEVPAQPKVEVPAQPKVEVPAQPKVEVPVQPKAEESVEQKVRNLIKNNIISKSDLENVLGREADYPTQIVGNLKLRKQYLKPFYEVN
jgi:outer membrane biosynthesis protein TonB